MGVVLNWSTGYTGNAATIDDRVTDMPTLTDGVHDVMASHVNSLADAVITLQTLQSTSLTPDLQAAYDQGRAINASLGPITISRASFTDTVIETYEGAAKRMKLFPVGIGGPTFLIVQPDAVTNDDVDGRSLTVWAGTSGPADAGAPRGGTLDLDAGSYNGPGTTSGTIKIGRTNASEITSGLEGTGSTWTHEGDLVITSSGQFSVGSVASPSIAFFAEPDTGIYLIGTNELGIAAGGTLAIDILPVQIRVPQGLNNGSPGIAFHGDTNTGIYSRVADEVNLTAGGTEVLRATPLQLFVPDGFSSGSPGIAFLSDSNTGILRIAADTLGLSAGGVAVSLSTTSLSPVTNKAVSLGSSSKSWNEGYVSQLVTDQMLLSGSFNTSTNPAIRFNDTDTGLYSPVEDKLVAAVGGNDIVAFNTNGIVVQTHGAGPSITFTNDMGTGIDGSGDPSLTFWIEDTNCATLSSAGFNVTGGIFMSAPGARIELQSHGGYNNSQLVTKTFATTTTNTTPTVMEAITLNTNSVYWVEVNVIARDSSGTNRAYFRRAQRVHQNGAGTAALSTNLYADNDVSGGGWSIDFNILGTQLQIRAIGAASIIYWAGTVRYQCVSTSS